MANLGNRYRGVNGFQLQNRILPARAIVALALNRPVRPVRLRAFMRLAVVLSAGLIGLLTASAQNPLSKLEHTPRFDNDYVRLSDGAKTCKFQPHWMRPSEEEQLTNASARLVFTLDSHRAGIDGVTVLPSAPVLAQNGIGRVGP